MDNNITDRSPNRGSNGLEVFTSAVKWLFGRWPVGYSHDLVYEGGEPYLERRILWLGGATLRYHVFHKGDQDRHMHDHPWWFITFPLDDYVETVDVTQHENCYLFNPGCAGKKQTVRKYRFHFRPAEYRHIVHAPPKGATVRTFVLSGGKSRNWGFWVNGEFVYYKEYEG